MTDKRETGSEQSPSKRIRKHAWTEKPRSEWTEEDWDDHVYYQNHRKPLRFQFGPDTTDEDIDNFLDTILGPKQDETGEKADQQE